MNSGDPNSGEQFGEARPEREPHPADSTEIFSAERPVPYEPPVRPVWRFVVAAVFILAIDSFAPYFAFKISDTHPILQDALYRSIGLVSLLLGFQLMLRVFDEVEPRDIIPELGFPRRNAVRELLTGAALGIALIAIAVAIIAIRGHVEFAVAWNSSSPRHIIEILVLLVTAAAYEEVGYRGYAFQRLTMSIGPVGAIVVFSIWFGALHLGNPHSNGRMSWQFFNTVAVGVLFAVAYLRTRALWMPIGLHFGWNFALGTLFGLPVSGLDFFAVVIHGKAIGPHWLTGGGYGLEASLTGAVVIMLGFVPVIVLTRRATPRI